MQPEPTIPEPEPSEQVLDIEETKLRKVLNLVQCEKCKRKMTEKTLKYSHEGICPANKKADDIITKPKRTKKGKVETIDSPIQQLEKVEQAPVMPLLRRQISNAMLARQDKLNQKRKRLNNC